ncbi:MAG: hypothetical protein L6246_08470 [Thermodesulfovibrionales bacterium]|nr:hypothetical protein [Nitrospinota bacterium]MCG2710331.1 hypothetical protein [Thermodesulfovibrionales bacterium]
MAEIIDSEKIRQKLKDFDNFIQQSIATLEALKRIKDDAQKMFSDMQNKKGQISAIEDRLKELLAEGENVTQEIKSSKIKAEKEVKNFIEEYSNEANSLNFFVKLRKQEIDKFLSDTKQELLQFVESKLNELESFKSQIKDHVDSSMQKAEKGIADFLYKQNALISNLNQQIDSYHKLIETTKDNLNAQVKEIEGLKNTHEEHRKLIESLTSQNAEIKTKMEEIMSELKKPLIKKIFGGK